MRARTPTRAALATLAVCAFTVAPAAASIARHVSSFGPTGVEVPFDVAVEQAKGNVYVTGAASGNVEKFNAAGEPEPSFSSPAFENPLGIAVDNSGDASRGDVYVSQTTAEGSVVKLDPSGKAVPGFTPIAASSIPSGKVGSAEFRPWGVAVDPANGDVVVADNANGEVDIFSSSGAFITQFAGGAYGVAVGSGSRIFTTGGSAGAQEWSPSEAVPYSTPIAIDPSDERAIGVDLSSGDVLADDTSYIAEYEASGAPLLQYGAGLLESSFGVAVDEATDTVYATNIDDGLVYVFGAPVVFAEAVTGKPATGVTGTTASVSGSVNPLSPSVPVTDCSFEYGLSATYGYRSPCSQEPPLTGSAAIPVSGNLSGLQPDTTYHYRLVAVNANGTSHGEDQTFKTGALEPSLDNQSVSALTQTSVILNARINPNNEATTYRFQFGLTTAYGTELPAPDAAVGSGYGDVVVGQRLTGLSPGTTYHFRAIATNATSPVGGTAGPDETFTTPPVQPPVVSTGQAEGVAPDAATLTGTVDTDGFETTYEFDLGTDTGYGSRIFGDAGSEAGAQTLTVPLQGLAPGTTYHYRVVATNIFGTSYGVDETFTTPTISAATITAPAISPLIASPLLRSGAETTTTTGRPAAKSKAKRKRKAGKKAKKANRPATRRKFR
jgi:DNA-binding beta-propeller fold protein YncE